MTTPADLFIIRIYVTYACRFMTFKGRYKKSLPSDYVSEGDF